MCAVWLRSRRLQSSLRPRPHVTRGSETREGNSSSQKALHSYAILTEPPVQHVTPSDRDDAATATSAEVTLHSETFLATPGPSTTRTPGCGAQRPAHRSATSSDFAAGALDDSPLPNCSIRDIVLTELDKQLLAELRRASAMALQRCIVSRSATAWAESLEGAISSHQSWALLCRHRCRLLWPRSQKHRIETTTSNVGGGSSQRAFLPNSRTAILWTASQEKTSDAATDGRTARETSLRLDSQRIHQQSRERTRGWSSARFRRVPKELDRSPDPTEHGQRNSSHQCRVCRGGEDCLGWWEVQGSARRNEGGRPQQDRCAAAGSLNEPLAKIQVDEPKMLWND